MKRIRLTIIMSCPLLDIKSGFMRYICSWALRLFSLQLLSASSSSAHLPPIPPSPPPSPLRCACTGNSPWRHFSLFSSHKFKLDVFHGQLPIRVHHLIILAYHKIWQSVSTRRFKIARLFEHAVISWSNIVGLHSRSSTTGTNGQKKDRTHHIYGYTGD